MRVIAFTQMFGQLSPIIPFIFTAPFYFARKIELGTMTQTAQAFGQVSTSLTFFVNYYTYLASFKSVVDRLNSFDAAIDTAQSLSEAGPARVAAPAGASAIDVDDLELSLPDRRPIVEVDHLELKAHESVALSGPSGTGKSTLFRAIAGIWPFGEGRIARPASVQVMVVPPKPYIPIGSLRSAVTYPALPGTYKDDDIRTALADAHLPRLVGELDHEEVWSQRLSSGEQQRLALARALLVRPDWLFLDEFDLRRRREARGATLRRPGASAAGDDDHVDRPSFGGGRAPPAPPRNEPGSRSLHAARRRQGGDGGAVARWAAIRPFPAH